MGLFNFLKAGGERIKLAKTFALIYSEEKTLSSLGIDEMKSKTLDLVYVAKKGIVERMEREQMSMIHKLSIPAITGSSINTITIMQAWKLTISRLLEISEMHDFEDEVKQILFEEQLELEKKMESIIPLSWKNW